MPNVNDDLVIDLRDGSERERMVRAAWSVLERSGWDGLKVERVLVEAGLSTRSFYRHFSNKNELLAVMLESDIDLLGSILDVSLSSWTDPVDQVVAWMTDLVQIVGGEAGIDHARFFMAHWFKLSVEFPDLVGRCEDRIEVPLARVIEEGARRGDFTSIDPRLDAHILRGLAMDCLGGFLTRVEPEVDSVVLSGVVRFALHALCGRIEGDVEVLKAGALRRAR